mgnify:FL=1
MFCEECGTQLEEGMLFCPNCGMKVENEPVPKLLEESAGTAGALENAVYREVKAEEVDTVREEPSADDVFTKAVFCPHCGAVNHGDDPFCANCGGALGDSEPSASAPARKRKNVLALGSAIAAVFVALALIGSLFLFRGTGSPDEIYYIKDSALCRSSLKKVEPQELDEDLLDDEVEAISAYIGMQYSENKQYLFYFHIENDGDRALYYIDTKDKKGEPQKIDSGVQNSFYEVTPDNRVIYCKNDNLYIHDLQDKEKVASDVGRFLVSQDGSTLVWFTQEDDRMYVQDTDLKNDREKIDSEVNWIYFYSEDLDYIVYGKGDSLYLLENLSDREKIDSDVLDVVTTVCDNDTVRILYRKSESSKTSMWDFIEDDLSGDADMEMPNEQDYQTTSIRKSWGRTYEVVETSDEYYEKLNAYYDKQSRDSMRETLKQMPAPMEGGSLELYDSASDETTTLAEGWLGNLMSCADMGENTVAIYSLVEEDDVSGPRFSEIVEKGISEADESLNRSLEENRRLYLAVGENVAEILDEEQTVKEIAGDGETLYVVVSEQDGEEEPVYEIGELSLDASDLGNYTCLYEDAWSILSCENGNLVYCGEFDPEHQSCDLYIGDNKVDSDVHTYSVRCEENGHIIYYTDREDDIGTLKLYDGKETKKIADDTRSALYFDDRKIAVLVDFSSKHNRGDLKLYNGKELIKIDTDVSRIIML